MSLKRKASFSTTQPSSFKPSPCDWDTTDNSKHMNSRTRKRFRDGRPSDEIVYAQKQQQSSTPMDTSDEMMEAEQVSPTPEAIDPRQQTLLQFFQPRTQPMLPFKPSREALAPQANETAIDQADAMRRQTFEQRNLGVPNGSGTASNGFNQLGTETDMDMDVDTDQSSEGSNFGSKMDFSSQINQGQKNPNTIAIDCFLVRPSAPPRHPAMATDAEKGAQYLESLLGQVLRIHTTDSRIFVGLFKCTDAERNIILSNTLEYRPPTPSAVQEAALKEAQAREKAETKATTVKVNMTNRFIGLVVVPGRHITRIELEERARGL
ncbi:Ribonucleoprotein LSM domain eukaryotic/archaea-type [Penicillium chermesinum]|nr:Ribonucleoprotein LSM domain eukaryotic/archaea-type [Penicillium chermesinum]